MFQQLELFLISALSSEKPCL